MDIMVYGLCKKMINQSISTIGNIFTLKGSVPTYDDLPLNNNKQGDIYLVGPMSDGSFDEYYWISSGKWELMGSTAGGLGGYVTINTLYAGPDGTGTPENPAPDTILSVVNSKSLTLDNNEEYIPTGDYNPATKKYVDDIRAELEKAIELEII